MGHLALGDAPQQVLSVSIGSGNSFRTGLRLRPVVADGRVYTIDTLGTVRAFDSRTAKIWATRSRGEQGQRGVALRRRRRL